MMAPFQYEDMYGEEISTTQLVTRLAAVMQEYTQSGCAFFQTFVNHWLEIDAFISVSSSSYF